MESLNITPWIELDMAIRLIIAALIGGLLGYERERAAKPAGFRTNILVCMGAALFTIISVYGFKENSDISRVAASVVVGVGFLGAGTIIRREGGVAGLTTAATIWVLAAIGMAIGAGLYISVLVATGITFVALRFPRRK